MALSKRLRFEIFKRDHFTCLYCGRKPTEVILNVDHLTPVSKGGTNDQHNLVTSCHDCNSGKSDVPLSEVPHGHQQTLADRQEKLDQLKSLNDLTIQISKEKELAFECVSDKWMSRQGDDPEKWKLSGEPESAVRRFLDKLPTSEVLDAVDVTFNKVGHKSQYSIFKYFCGCCWRKIQRAEDQKLNLPSDRPQATAGVL